MLRNGAAAVVTGLSFFGKESSYAKLVILSEAKDLLYITQQKAGPSLRSK
jgi:hypothetical protein